MGIDAHLFKVLVVPLFVANLQTHYMLLLSFYLINYERKPFSLNTLRPRQNGRHFADDTFKHIFLNENVRISIKISLKFKFKVQSSLYCSPYIDVQQTSMVKYNKYMSTK